jgi:hypothetical protein
MREVDNKEGAPKWRKNGPWRGTKITTTILRREEKDYEKKTAC